MTHLQKVRLLSYFRWVSLDLSGSSTLGSSKTTLWPTGFNHIVQGLRFYATEISIPSEDDCQTKRNSRNKRGPAASLPKEAQAALMEYLHSTRSLQFSVAESLSRNSPNFLRKLMKKANVETEVGRSISRFLRYHPINEFEPFFESIGLRPSEYSSFLPHKLMFLNDDAMLLENYQVLCNYGIERESIGKIYKQAKDVFEYDYGVLQSKLQHFENIGLEQSAVAKFVSSSPNLLIGDKSRELGKVIEKFESIGIESGWFEGHILAGCNYNWSRVLELLCSLSKLGCSDKQVEEIVRQSPAILSETSVNAGFSLIGFLLKFGSSMHDIASTFSQLPQVQVTKFLCNLRNCYEFLVHIEMDVLQIGKFVRSHPLLLGSCSLKKTSSLFACLYTGKKRVCEMVKENPEILKEWVLGSKVKPLPDTGEELRSLMMKTKFLLDLGFVENSNEMQKALKVFRGKGLELQERFDIFVKAGLDRDDVLQMIKGTPKVLNLSKDVIKQKIEFLINVLGYPLSTLLACPSYLSCTTQKVKLRHAMYDWLKDHGQAKANLSLSTILSSSDKCFVKNYVNRHPKGPKAWEELKKRMC